VRQLRRAIIERATVRFCYHTRYVRNGQSTQQTREADPYGLVHYANAWHLVAYCHLRQDIRNFRLDRMENLELLSRTFQRPTDFKMHQRRQEEAQRVVVRALFDQEVARWVRESRSYFTVAEEESAQGLLVTFQVRQESEILQWLLSWGRHVQVLEPESLRSMIAEEAVGMLRNHQNDPGNCF
jgi:predicted DNA-binding transcriptional regulator YafY